MALARVRFIMGSLERYRCGSGRAPTSSGNLSEDTLPVPSRTTSVQVRSRTDFFSGDTGADAAERRSPFGRRLTPPSDDSVSSQAASARIRCKTIPSQMVSAQVRPRTDPFGAGISADTVEQRYLRGQLPCCDFANVCLLGGCAGSTWSDQAPGTWPVRAHHTQGLEPLEPLAADPRPM